MNKAPISEIFSSLQGEGIFVGIPQIFIRFSGCNLEKCAFCDEPARRKSDLGIREIITRIKQLSKKTRPHSISLTGGEPLLYPQFLKRLSKELKERGFLIYLETNGTLPENLSLVKKYTDFVAMDIKLPSSTGLGSYFIKHKKFLKVVSDKKVFVKVIVTKKTNFSCFKKAVGLVKAINREIPFVIQPATKVGRVKGPDKEKILLFQNYALKFLKDPRIIPQMHKKLGVK